MRAVHRKRGDVIAKKATIVAVTNQKGGVGKSTTCENLGVGLAAEGKKVLLVDTDPQGSLTISMGWQQPDELPTTLSTLMQKAMNDQPIQPGEGVLHHAEGIDLIPANIELAGLEVALVNSMNREKMLKQVLDSAKREYDFILLDCMYDVQISSRYNDVYDEENLPDDNYELVTDFLSEHGIETDYDCTFSLYLPSKDDFHNRMKYDFPVVAISLSDCNTIRKMLGYEPITLSEDEFTTQWQSIATNEERDSFLKEHSSILTDAGELTLSEHSFYEEAIGETAYNSYTDVLYVFPDSICENLLSVIRNRYIMTTESISYENARTLEQAFSAEYPEITDTGVSYAIRLSTLQVNTTKASNFVLQASMLYAAVVLMVICLTVLSLQQLLDASQYKYRFSVLRKLGVEDTHIGKLVLKQLGIWFGLPIVVAIIVSTMVIIYFIQTISAEISAYIGFGALMTQIGMTVSILALLLICYFISTWLLFKKSIK